MLFIDSILGRKSPLPRAILLTDAERDSDYAKILHRWRRQPLLIIVRHWQASAQATLLETLKPHASPSHHFSLTSPALAAKYRLKHLHLPEQTLKKRGKLKLLQLKKRFILTTSVHSLPALKRAERAGVHAVLLSPVFPTASHPNGKTLGAYQYRCITKQARLPVYPLGGVTPKNIARLYHTRLRKRIAGLVFYLQI
jgi:thiamine-phosphate pyrophosphorylase